MIYTQDKNYTKQQRQVNAEVTLSQCITSVQHDKTYEVEITLPILEEGATKMQFNPDVSIKSKQDMPKLVIVMGVSGCGKSTVGKELAQVLGYEFIEADDFHSVAAKQQMADGIPLTDAMRDPWLRRLTQHLCQGTLVDSVLAYSGLRRRHRQLFRELGFTTLFIHLTTDLDTISQRMSLRAGHFMPESMLASQFSSMQLPESEADIISLDVSADLQHTIERAHAAVALM